MRSLTEYAVDSGKIEAARSAAPIIPMAKIYFASEPASGLRAIAA